MRVGVLTGGGDCPGLNAVIRAVVRQAIYHYNGEVVGFLHGWRGPLEDLTTELTMESTEGILPRGGTILRSSRTNLYRRESGEELVRRSLERHRLDGLIAIGGDDTLGTAHRLGEAGMNVIGVPKTIDNDLGATDQTFGFDTAIHVATDAIDRLHTTAESHNRILVVEVMGRNAGWIALHSGIAGGADVILIPEVPFDIDEVCAMIKRRHQRGRYYSIVVAAEGATPKEGTTMTLNTGETDEFGHPRLGGIGHRLEQEIERRTGFETRATVLGHVQRGGTPTAFDRVLATRLGLAAIDAAHDRKWGMMTSLHATDIKLVPIAEAVKKTRSVPVEEYHRYDVLFG
jgi:phosphofructokinase-like protein